MSTHHPSRRFGCWHTCLAAALLAGGTITGAVAQDLLVDNPDLQRLKDADQADRSPGIEAIDWRIVNARDEQRRSAVIEMLRAGQLRSANDYANAALIYQLARRPTRSGPRWRWQLWR